jgi:hypothetical protein
VDERAVNHNYLEHLLENCYLVIQKEGGTLLRRGACGILFHPTGEDDCRAAEHQKRNKKIQIL